MHDGALPHYNRRVQQCLNDVCSEHSEQDARPHMATAFTRFKSIGLLFVGSSEGNRLPLGPMVYISSPSKKSN